MAKSRFNFLVRGNLINGKFEKPTENSAEWVAKSPGDLSDEIARICSSSASIDRAVGVAGDALVAWKALPFPDRAACVRRAAEVLGVRLSEMAEMIARECGRPLWDAEEELRPLAAAIDLMIEESQRAVKGFATDATAGGRSVCGYRPVGVMAVIGPFPLPVSVACGHIFPALLAGNTVVYKPSERTACVGQLLAECFQTAFPPGVFNLIQGDREIGRRLCVHEAVQAVLFSGSYETATRIRQDTLQQHWKLVVLEMGAKNSAIVWDDVDFDRAVQACMIGGFQSAGQRCLATSRVIVRQPILDRFLSRLHERAKAFSIGNPLENPFMGPLIDSSAVDRYMKFLGIASREGCEVVMRGKTLELPVRGNYVTPSVCFVKDSSVKAAKKSIYQQTEFLAPNVAVLAIDTVEEAIELANATQYGLAASVFSASRAVFEKCRDGIQCGLINWNRGTNATTLALPMGGLKKSGNFFPTGAAASRYCLVPVSSIEAEAPVALDRNCPGLNWS